jgi:hypothetical protein
MLRARSRLYRNSPLVRSVEGARNGSSVALPSSDKCVAKCSSRNGSVWSRRYGGGLRDHRPQQGHSEGSNVFYCRIRPMRGTNEATLDNEPC